MDISWSYPHSTIWGPSLKRGGGTDGGRRPEVVAPPASATPELQERPRRRSFTAADKLRILGEVERAAGVRGGGGAIMRREGLYSSALSDWRLQRDAGAFGALSPVKRGRKPAGANPLAGELVLAQLRFLMTCHACGSDRVHFEPV